MRPHSSPSVQMAVEAIRNQIRSGAYKSGSFLPPETGLAEGLEVSRGTVRRAIEVLVKSGEISRRPFARPRVALGSSSSSVKGSEVHVWISHPIADGPTLQFLRGISNGLMGTDLRLVVREPSRFFGQHVKKEERQFLTELLQDDSVAGAIMERDAYAENDDLYRLLVERNKHLVFVDIPPPEGVVADYVGTANLSAAQHLTVHLLQQGHSNIVFAGESTPPATVRDRIKGYWRGLKHAGLESNGCVLNASDLPPMTDTRAPSAGLYSRLLNTSSDYNERSQRLIKAILNMNPRPTAIVASCDVLAHWLCALLEGSGLSIPGDFAITGFDWLARWDDPSLDILTTANQDFEGFGYYAAELILDRVYEDSEPVARKILLPAPLVVRSSTVTENISATDGYEARGRMKRFH